MNASVTPLTAVFAIEDMLKTGSWWGGLRTGIPAQNHIESVAKGHAGSAGAVSTFQTKWECGSTRQRSFMKAESRTVMQNHYLRGRWMAAASALAVALLFLSASPQPKADETKQAYTAEEFLAPIKYLASDELKGRGDGTPELNQAADYIASQFKRDGLRPAGDQGTYLQHFTITVGANLGPKNSVSYTEDGKPKSLTLKEDFLPFSFSESLEVRAPLVFAGFGITAGEFNYDDYKGRQDCDCAAPRASGE
jgi:hypothetical protein